MKEIIGIIKAYYHEVNKLILLLCSLFTGILIWLNYDHHLEYELVKTSTLPFAGFTGDLLIFLTAFLVPYLLLISKRDKMPYPASGFWFCLFGAPVIFAIKVNMNTNMFISFDRHWNDYWNVIAYWPFRLIIIGSILIICKELFNKRDPLYGLSVKKINYSPYFILLLIMVPLIAAASTQHDFLSTYPKMKMILPLPENSDPGWFYKLLFQLSYGSDFFTIELFFRGFLVIGFMKWVGKDAILPMACFYCTIHFGKPMAECISSYFGGMLLGIISYHTQSIYGGLLVHLGIAWLMEAGGYIGNMNI
ncbi:MAG: CPBP family intramembrane glutamic endopeptidase [Chitinophagaceae bacterium]